MHICNIELLRTVWRHGNEKCDGDNDNENEIDKEFDEARERKIKNIIITRKGDDVMDELCDTIKDEW